MAIVACAGRLGNGMTFFVPSDDDVDAVSEEFAVLATSDATGECDLGAVFDLMAVEIVKLRQELLRANQMELPL